MRLGGEADVVIADLAGAVAGDAMSDTVDSAQACAVRVDTPAAGASTLTNRRLSLRFCQRARHAGAIRGILVAAHPGAFGLNVGASQSQPLSPGPDDNLHSFGTWSRVDSTGVKRSKRAVRSRVSAKIQIRDVTECDCL